MMEQKMDDLIEGSLHQQKIDYEATHPDGIWKTTTHLYKGRKILIKAQKNKGMKAHVFYPDSDKVEFTRRYRFIKPDVILQVVKDKIDGKEKENKKNSNSIR